MFLNVLSPAFSPKKYVLSDPSGCFLNLLLTNTYLEPNARRTPAMTDKPSSFSQISHENDQVLSINGS